MITYRYFLATDAGNLADFARQSLTLAAARLGTAPTVALCHPADLAAIESAELDGVKLVATAYVARRGLMIGARETVT